MKNLRLFSKIYLHAIGLMLLVIAALVVARIVLADDEDWVDLHLRLAAHLAENTAHEVGDPQRLNAHLGHIREVLGVDLTYYDLNGALLASNVDPPLPPLRAGETMGAVARGVHCTSPTEWHVIAPLRAANGDAIAYLVLEDSVHPLPPTRERVITCAALLVLLALVSIPLARAIASPLERLAKTAAAFGSGDLRVRTGIDRKDEVGQVARAFDDMAARIEQLVLREKELLANVSHELRTPLARIRVALEIAEEGDVERARATIADIATDLDELERIVGDLLTAARLDRALRGGEGAPPLRRERVRASELVERAAARFRSAHPERDLRVTITEDRELDADPALLRRVVDNLLDNARKYSDAPITLSARAADDRLLLEVEDRGIGIDEADLPNLFTPFYRTEKSRTRTAGGVGLGLTLARRIVEAHGGDIAITSRPGEGTTVRLSVPAR
jgi:two-component system, OmpR family, sensor kinase